MKAPNFEAFLCVLFHVLSLSSQTQGGKMHFLPSLTGARREPLGIFLPDTEMTNFQVRLCHLFVLVLHDKLICLWYLGSSAIGGQQFGRNGLERVLSAFC